MRKITLLILAFTLAFNVNAQNQKMNDIQELMDCVGMDKLGNQMVDGFISMYKTDYGDNIPGLWDTLSVVINESIVDLMDSIAIIYDKLYTHEEIKSIMEIYQTPIGKKIIETIPVLTELSMQAGQNWALANADKIEERITPLIENYSKKEITINDFFNPDEKYEYDTPKVITDASSNNTKTQGSPDYKYSVNYDSEIWDIVPDETFNPFADLTFVTYNQEAYAMIIAETSVLTIQELKAAAIYNMASTAENMKTESIGLREVNGKEVLCMRLSCDIQEVTYKYYNYYYSGDWGVLQFIVFATNENYDENLKYIEDILSGLYVE